MRVCQFLAALLPKREPAVKLIELNTSGVREPEDPVYPYKLEASFRPPEFMLIAFIGLFGGTEYLVIQAKSLKALQRFVKKNGYRNHPRLRELTVTGPQGPIVDF